MEDDDFPSEEDTIPKMVVDKTVVVISALFSVEENSTGGFVVDVVCCVISKFNMVESDVVSSGLEVVVVDSCDVVDTLLVVLSSDIVVYSPECVVVSSVANVVVFGAELVVLFVVGRDVDSLDDEGMFSSFVGAEVVAADDSSTGDCVSFS